MCTKTNPANHAFYANKVISLNISILNNGKTPHYWSVSTKGTVHQLSPRYLHICRLCRDEISKLGSEGHTPRWRKVEETSDKICYVPGCSNPSYKVTQLASNTTLDELFDIRCENEHPTSTCDKERGYPLCQEH